MYVNYICFHHPSYFSFTVSPDTPSSLNVSVVNWSSLNITWDSPIITGGKISSYMITVYPPPSLSYSNYIEGVCNTTEEFFILSGLNYNTNYTINVSASNCAGTGGIASISMELILMSWLLIISYINQPGEPVGVTTSV